MADTSSIEWTDATWNPIAGCSLKSPGCANCYAMPMAYRHELMSAASGRVSPYAGLTRKVNGKAVWTGKMRLVEAALALPLRWTKPRRIFVNSMSDLFHEDVPDDWIDRVFAVMALAPHHTFQVLTKRPARMREWFEERWQPTLAQRIECPGLPAIDMPAQAEGDDRHERVYQAAGEFLDLDTVSDRFWNPDGSRKWPGWPLPNVWLGVSAEDQRRADERVPDLLATPAAVRFVSAEPMLGPIDFEAMPFAEGDPRHRWSALTGQAIMYATGEDGHPDFTVRMTTPIKPRLDWIIVGGESGPGARPMHPDWARHIRDACAASSVAFHFKQWGSWKPELDRELQDPDWRADYSCRLNDREPNIAWLNLDGGRGFHGERFHVMRRVAKGIAGRLLDGAVHDGMPEVHHG